KGEQVGVGGADQRFLQQPLVGVLSRGTRGEGVGVGESRAGWTETRGAHERVLQRRGDRRSGRGGRSAAAPSSCRRRGRGGGGFPCPLGRRRSRSPRGDGSL